MKYKKHLIQRSDPVEIKGRRRGVIEVVNADNDIVKFVTYSIGNHPARMYAIAQAKKWVDEQT